MGRATWPKQVQTAHLGGNSHEMLGIVGRCDVGGKHQVVGRLLAGLPQLPGRQPNQRMEPVRHAGQPAQQQHQAVAAADMP